MGLRSYKHGSFLVTEPMGNEPEAVGGRLLITKGNVRRNFLLPVAILSLFLSENLGALAECP